jgi:hypothetical protein
LAGTCERDDINPDAGSDLLAVLLPASPLPGADKIFGNGFKLCRMTSHPARDRGRRAPPPTAFRASSNAYLLTLVAVAPEEAEASAVIEQCARAWALRAGSPPRAVEATPLGSASPPTGGVVFAPTRAFLLARGTHLIGRAAGCALHFPLRGISRHHVALLVLQARGVVIRDLGSTNGTFVNGERIREAALDGPALLDIGPLRLVLRPVIGDSRIARI